MARRRKNPWTSVGEVLVWVLFAVLLVPVGFAGWAVGHYTSLGKPSATVTVTTTVAQTKTVTTSGGTAAKPPTTTAAPATTSAAAAAGNPAKGKAVFASAGCAACHTFAPAGASGTIGPNLDSAPTADAKIAGMSLTAFVKESIVKPDAFIPKGFPKGVMPANFGTSLSGTQLDDLVAFIVSGQK